MSRHDVITGPWASPEAYRPRGSGGRSGPAAVLAILLAAVAIGLGVGWMLQPRVDDASGKPDAPIEWNVMAPAQTRAPDVEDVEWAKRAAEQDGPSTSSGRTEDAQAEMPRVLRGHSGAASAPKVYVIDGDTFVMGGHKVRVAGIDAPETHPSRCAEEARLGNAATGKLRALLSGGTVTVSGSGHDQYGRDLRRVSVNGQDVGEAMIGTGLARSYDGKKRQPWC